MATVKWILLISLLASTPLNSKSSDSLFIKVHFLYGSKPLKAYKDVESNWFGGIHGGHVGIEIDSNRIMDFVPSGGFHYIAHKQNFKSEFQTHNLNTFWEIFGGTSESVKKLTIVIPISESQKNELDSIYAAYTLIPPYDYAFMGMRCGAATYDVLSKLGIVEKHSLRFTYLKYFYPKKVRKLLLKKAQKNSWEIYRQVGSSRRKWEKD